MASWRECFAEIPDAQGGEPSQIATFGCLPYLLDNLITTAIMFAGIVAVFFIIWGGYKFIRSGGDPKQVDGARQTITYAIIGLIIVFASYFIINFIATITGVECIKRFGFGNCQNPSATTATSTPTEGTFGCFKNKTDPNASDPTSETISQDPTLLPLCQAYIEGENTPPEPIGPLYYTSKYECVNDSICEQ